MQSKRCFVCAGSLSSPTIRQQSVSALAKRLSEGKTRDGLIKNRQTRDVYPRIFRLLDRLPLCIPCMEALPFISGPHCPGCGRVMADAQTCTDCRQYTEGHLQCNRSIMSYQEWGKEQIRQLKYRGDEHLAALLATLLAIGYYRFYAHLSFHVITHVPLHPARLQERGFDQAALLAKHFGNIVNIPAGQLLIRQKNTDKLSKQTGKYARFKSMQNAFAPRAEWLNRDWITAPHLLIIDDIYTTGSTLRSCAAAIRSIPSMSQAAIFGLTIFR